MKALSLHQPFASLLVTRQPCERCDGRGWWVGPNRYARQPEQIQCECSVIPPSMVKAVETRSWPCPPKLIGQRIAFHAAKRKVDPQTIGRYQVEQLRREAVMYELGVSDDIDLPLGAIVGSGVITASLPIVGMADCTDHGEHVCHQVGGGLLHHRDIGAPTSETDISDQLPYGDFTPGRYAWIIDDAAATTERCPWCGGKAQEPGFHWGDECTVCDGAGRCDPVPAKGRQRIWEWAPGAIVDTREETEP